MTPLRYSLVLVALLFFAWPAHAAMVREQVESIAEEKQEQVSRDLFEFESSYVFESELSGHGLSGNQSAFSNYFSYGHRFLLDGHVYLNLGISYDRFDFGSSGLPVPDHLQSISAPIAIEYMHNNDIGAFIQVKPGFYTENDFGTASFDAPITLGRIFVLQQDRLYLFAGANAAFLRGQFPVIPLFGVIWVPNDKWRLMGVLPEPRLIYSPWDHWQFWVGGQLTGGSFRTDRDDTITPSQLSNAQVDYTDYRAGTGLIYSPREGIEFDLGGGCSIERTFDFYRADFKYQTDPAPYLRFEFKAKF